MSRVLSLAGFEVTLIGRFWVIPEDGVQTLNCGDADLADLVQLVGLKMLDVVKLGE